MGTRECDLDPGDDFEPGDLLIALEGEDIFLVSRGRDVFESPQGCSRTHPVGKDENSRPVGGALFSQRRRAAAERALSAQTKACAIDQVGSLIEWLWVSSHRQGQRLLTQRRRGRRETQRKEEKDAHRRWSNCATTSLISSDLEDRSRRLGFVMCVGGKT